MEAPASPGLPGGSEGCIQQHSLPLGGQRQLLQAGLGHLCREFRDPRPQLGSEGRPSGWAPCGPVNSSPSEEGTLMEKGQSGGPSGLGLRAEKASDTGLHTE